MSEFSITSMILKRVKRFQRNLVINLKINNQILKLIMFQKILSSIALIMDDPDAMAAVGKIWVHWLDMIIMFQNFLIVTSGVLEGLNDFGELGYGGPAPPNGRHTYIFKGICT